VKKLLITRRDRGHDDNDVNISSSEKSRNFEKNFLQVAFFLLFLLLVSFIFEFGCGSTGGFYGGWRKAAGRKAGGIRCAAH
jgi:hypothetical protein